MKNKYISIFDYKLLNNNYHFINILFIIFITLVISIGIIISNKIYYYYYYETVGIYNNKEISLLVNIDKIKDIANNSLLLINKHKYRYNSTISKDLTNINNTLYQEVLLKTSYNTVNNRHLKLSIITKKEKLWVYLKNQITGG